MEFEREINNIMELRKEAFRPTLAILILLVLGFLSQILFVSIGLIFGLLAFMLFYKSIVRAARAPCPRCGESFGTKSNIVLGVGGDSCQSCGLNICVVKRNQKS